MFAGQVFLDRISLLKEKKKKQDTKQTAANIKIKPHKNHTPQNYPTPYILINLANDWASLGLSKAHLYLPLFIGPI